ncbi:uncharacterized protein [Spinacia oleracea]|uniref:Uncharacterized protein isoform X2 n=1 Tax=Spinacia oleracea TaxID=3562 RepID=A0ABM3RA81_SPIOL|nr:uncharacterized protein LOC130460029 isoform X2 [Spinacia oleracea]XP_056686334.1 uncharacterized protein LOC130462027 isoform X2 [Spinacia oleracea]XP_056686336.1 uncharacterized protein LOC130462028 isoform X2 [Spinacia oleracea]XP_056689854.1 uncharacterized protein LOC130464341 isoform X2 [Spinacia oleracea]XP_056689858.1 uncharacterized protein LOC130464346 isoform X2 [Spinacia oleracea]XP_056689861.1 uncharacterized protein LOC130464349 isoform X2 [Spinacia oleracea]XP_056691294.1 un
MGTREVYEEKLRTGNVYHHDPTINPGLGTPRCPRCLFLLDSDSKNGEWTITSVLHDATAVVPLFNIMNKFDGETITEVVRPQIARMRYRVTKLPPYIIVHMQRFTKNNFFVEKNPTLGLHSEDCALCEEFDVVREQWAKFFTNKYLLLALARLIELV